MKNITFVSAGAGSGKTYKLTQDIANLIKQGNGKYCAEKIILTTYTKAASQELREKVRSTLYAEGLYEAATNIDNAAIGTIHSIAYQLISRYWYLLGIGANVSILDEEGSNLYISQSLSSLPTKDDIGLFDDIYKAFNITKKNANGTEPYPDYWKDELKGLIDKTIELCIDTEQLEKAKDESKQLLSEVLCWNNFEITNDTVQSTLSRIKPIFEAIINRSSEAKREENRRNLYNSIKELEDYTGEIGKLPICKLASIASAYSTPAQKYIQKDFGSDIIYFGELAEKIPHSNQVKNLIESYIDTIFRLAIEWKGAYEEFKHERCILDNSDLLIKFDELLDNEAVVADIKSRYNIAFVDEFQDCSPLQVKSFKRLSDLMDHSVWVGDIKQAIYGFRGSNTELIKTIFDEIKLEQNGNKYDILEHCWRSNKTIVDLVNNLFCNQVFNGLIDKKFIKLSIPERKANTPAPQERELIHWHLTDGSKQDCPNALVEKVEELINKGAYKAKDIAILYKSNSDIKKCTKALREKGIPYNVKENEGYYEGNDANIDDISSFLTAVVSFAARGDNDLSKAIIANHIEEGYDTAKIISNKLRFIDEKTEGQDENKEEEWLAEVKVIKQISQLRNTIGNQSVSAAIETLITELNICDLIKRIDPTVPAYNYCSALKKMAETYENLCNNLTHSSTLVGFADYLKSKPLNFPGDDNGVSVLTYHKSKGLEWKCVILCSLHKQPIEKDKAYIGVLTLNTPEKTILRLIPYALKGICSNILDTFEDNDFFIGIRSETINEAKRLMYVGMTRPREQLILTTHGKSSGDQWLTDIGCEKINSLSNTKIINWGGYNWNHSVRNYVAKDPTDNNTSNELIEFKALKQPLNSKTFAQKYISPSKEKPGDSNCNAELLAEFSKRLKITATDGNDSTVGNFIHHLMCVWNGDRSIIQPLAAEYGVWGDADSIGTSVENFWTWMENTYGRATAIEREFPFSFTNKNGQIVNGEIDLVYHTDNGDILVDYKTYQGEKANLTDENSEFYAGKYSKQITLYNEALTLNGQNIRDRLIYYVPLGTIIRIK